MIYSVYAGISFLSVLLFGGAMLPFIAVGDHALAVSRRRAAYDKMAQQGMVLSILVNIFASVLIGADIAANGCAASMMSGMWLFFFMVVGGAAMVTGVLSLMAAGLKRSMKYIFFMLAALAGAFSEIAALLMLWGILRNRGGDVFQLDTASFETTLSSFYCLEFATFAVFVFFCGLAFAYGMLFCWHVVRRNRDDYGRDFYTNALRLRSRQSVFSCVFLTASAAALCWFLGEGASGMLFSKWLGASSRVIGGIGAFLVVFAALLWNDVARSEMPMRVRSTGFIAVLVLFAACFLALASA